MKTMMPPCNATFILQAANSDGIATVRTHCDHLPQKGDVLNFYDALKNDDQHGRFFKVEEIGWLHEGATGRLIPLFTCRACKDGGQS